jgi:hypothetical protein
VVQIGALQVMTDLTIEYHGHSIYSALRKAPISVERVLARPRQREKQ